MNLLLVLHVLGAVILIGNLIMTAFWKVRADVSGNAALIQSAVKSVMLADYCFTIPGIVLVVGSGSLMAARAGLPLSGLSWLTVSLVLFAISGLIWLFALIPAQRSMIRFSLLLTESEAAASAYKSASLRWAVFGITATVLPCAILVLMIAKPF